MDVEAEVSPEENSGPEPEARGLGPIRPSAEVRTEVEALLEADGSRLGDVYRGVRRGLSAEAIAEDLNVTTCNFVWNYRRIIKALLDGALPTAPTVAFQVARKFKSILKSPLSSALRSYLESNLEELERTANNETARAVEAEHLQEETKQAEALNEIGIYVYSLPHYLLHPFEPKSGRTLMKAGRSDSDVIARFRNQTRTTALPEEPVLLRIYRTDGAAGSGDAENDFHRLLEAAGHDRSVARSAGREWFVTHTKFLDEVARVMRLHVRIVNEVGVLE
ncbi:MAG: GIY-YIG nuclease family protein [Pseudonocardiaceae bacterium]